MRSTSSATSRDTRRWGARRALKYTAEIVQEQCPAQKAVECFRPVQETCETVRSSSFGVRLRLCIRNACGECRERQQQHRRSASEGSGWYGAGQTVPKPVTSPAYASDYQRVNAFVDTRY